MKKLRSIVLPLFTSVILASCGSGLEGVTVGNPPPTPPAPPTAVFIPQAGAAVNSGDGTIIGTVRISPNATDVEMMNLVNEVRTKGTLNGQDAIKGSCVEGSFKPDTLSKLTYDGMLSYAARRHAVYMTESGQYDHVETMPEHPAFFGTTGKDCIHRARSTFNQPVSDGKAVYENIVISRSSAAKATYDFMMSSGHCQSIMRASATRMAMGYTPAYDNKVDSWVQMFAN